MGYKCFFKLLESNYWRDCPITTDDAKRALHIYGTDIVMLRGKATKEKPKAINNTAYVNIPKTIQDHHPNIRAT
jgi:hypothetical protein